MSIPQDFNFKFNLDNSNYEITGKVSEGGCSYRIRNVDKVSDEKLSPLRAKFTQIFINSTDIGKEGIAKSLHQLGAKIISNDIPDSIKQPGEGVSANSPKDVRIPSPVGSQQDSSLLLPVTPPASRSPSPIAGTTMPPNAASAAAAGGHFSFYGSPVQAESRGSSPTLSPQTPSAPRTPSPINYQAFQELQISLEPRKKEALAAMPVPFQALLKDLAIHTADLSPGDHKMAKRNFDTGKQTIEAIVLLHHFRSEIESLDDTELTQFVRALTGIKMHPDLELGNKANFLANLDRVTTSLFETYADMHSETDRVRFFTKALLSPNCIEYRFDSIIDYGLNYKNMSSQLNYSVQDFNKSRKKFGCIVILNDLLPQLRKSDFFRFIGMNEDQFLKSPDLQRYMSNKTSLLRLKEEPQQLDPIDDRLMNDWAFFKEYDKGLPAFKAYILENTELTPSERQQIDKILADFFAANPKEKAKFG